MERPIKAHGHRAVRTELNVGDAEVRATQIEIAQASSDIEGGERRPVIPLQVRLKSEGPRHALGIGLPELGSEISGHDRTCTAGSRDIRGELTAECALQVRACGCCGQ